jgi:hypothetical protein
VQPFLSETSAFGMKYGKELFSANQIASDKLFWWRTEESKSGYSEVPARRVKDRVFVQIS